MVYANTIGRLGADAVEDQTPKGKKYYTFNIASDSYEGGQSVTEWIRVTVFDESLFRKVSSMKKGSQVFVNGKFKSRAYVSNDGTPKASLEMVANSIDFVGGHSGGTKSESDTVDPDKLDCGKMEETKAAPKRPKKIETPKAVEAASSSDDEDLPF